MSSIVISIFSGWPTRRDYFQQQTQIFVTYISLLDIFTCRVGSAAEYLFFLNRKIM